MGVGACQVKTVGESILRKRGGLCKVSVAAGHVAGSGTMCG